MQLDNQLDIAILLSIYTHYSSIQFTAYHLFNTDYTCMTLQSVLSTIQIISTITHVHTCIDRSLYEWSAWLLSAGGDKYWNQSAYLTYCKWTMNYSVRWGLNQRGSTTVYRPYISPREFVPGPFSFVSLACVDMKVEQQQKQRKIKVGLALCRWTHSKREDGFKLSRTYFAFGPHPIMFHLVSVMGGGGLRMRPRVLSADLWKQPVLLL